MVSIRSKINTKMSANSDECSLRMSKESSANANEKDDPNQVSENVITCGIYDFCASNSRIKGACEKR